MNLAKYRLAKRKRFMKILLVEQDRNLLSSLHSFLSLYGHEVEEAFDSVLAINLFDDTFDLVLIDEESPRKSLLSTLTYFKKNKEDIKIILLSKDFVIPLSFLLDYPILDAYLPRPFTEDMLLDLLTHIKDKKKHERCSLKEDQFLTLLEEKEILTFKEGEQLFFQEYDFYKTYLVALNKKLQGKEILVTEKGFKLVTHHDQ